MAKIADAQLQASLAFIAGTSGSWYEEAPCGFVFADAEGTLLKVNRTFLDWVGRTEQDLIGVARLQELLAPGSRIYFETHYRPLLRMQKFVREIAFDLVGRGGETIPVLVNSEEITDGTGQITVVRSTFFNVSVRRRYERELLRERRRAEHSEERFKLLAHAGEELRKAPDPEAGLRALARTASSSFCDACTVDLKRGGEWTRVAASHRQAEKEAVLRSTHPFSTIASPVLLPRLSDPSEAPAEPGFDGIIRLLNAESIVLAPVIDREETIGVLGFHMTDLRRPFADEDLGLAVELASRCSEAIRAHRLEREKERAAVELRESHERLSVEIEAKSRTLLKLQEQREIREKFVAMLTHDLRSPIAAVKISAQILARKADSPDAVRTQADRIVGSVNRVDRMIQDLLDANQIQAGGRIELPMARCDLASEIRETIGDLSTSHGDRFVLSGPEQLFGYWNCRGLRRIIENLCNNAVKYGASAAPITIGIREEADGAILFVHNEGNPIPPDEQETLFEPYRRSASAQQSGKKGWGLGLTLVRGVVESHGGRVSVESGAGIGTTFLVRLPLDAGQARD